MAELDNLRFIVEGLGLVSNLLMDFCKFYLFLQVFVGIFGIIGNISGILWFSRKLIQKNFHQVREKVFIRVSKRSAFSSFQLMLSLALCDLLYVLLRFSNFSFFH